MENKEEEEYWFVSKTSPTKGHRYSLKESELEPKHIDILVGVMLCDIYRLPREAQEKVTKILVTNLK